MKFKQLQHYLSEQRIARYLIATGGSKQKAQNLYRDNLRISQAFYPLLNLFEIVLRNAINQNLSHYFADENWIKNQKNGFMNDDSLSRSKYFLRNEIRKAEQRFRKYSSPVGSGKIIAELSFGFWTSLFAVHHYRLLSGSIIHCFPDKMPSANRAVIHKKLNDIRKFRNRIYHNEPICFSGNSVDFSLAQLVRNSIIELVSWIGSDIESFIGYFDNVQSRLNRVKSSY